IKSLNGPICGRFRSAVFRCGGFASANAWRTILRCTPNFFAMDLIVPELNSNSRLICSNNSTFVLLSNAAPPSRQRSRRNKVARLGIRGGPNQMIKVGQMRVSKSPAATLLEVTALLARFAVVTATAASIVLVIPPVVMLGPTVGPVKPEPNDVPVADNPADTSISVMFTPLAVGAFGPGVGGCCAAAARPIQTPRDTAKTIIQIRLRTFMAILLSVLCPRYV